MPLTVNSILIFFKVTRHFSSDLTVLLLFCIAEIQGFSLGLMQLALKILYPSKKRIHKKKAQKLSALSPDVCPN